MTDGPVLAVASAKGGVGKTTTSINLGTAAVTTTGRSVLLVEGDLAMANVLDFLDLPIDPGVDPTLHDVLSGGATVEEAVVTARSGLDVLPCGDGLDGFVSARKRALIAVIRTARSLYDAVIVDTGAGVSRATLLPIALASGVVVVSTPRVSAIRDTQKTIDLVDRVGGSTVGAIITRTGTGNAPPPQRLADFLGVPLLGSVPDDRTVPRSQDSGEAAVTYSPEAPAARAYLDAAVELDLTNDAAASPPTPDVREPS